MAGIKRKNGEGIPNASAAQQKKLRPSKTPNAPTAARSSRFTAAKAHKTQAKERSEDLIESDTSESENGFYGFSAKESDDAGNASSVSSTDRTPSPPVKKKSGEQSREKRENGVLDEHGHLKSTSREAHAQQKALSKQRKAAKPNADSIARSKILWERLRRKSHVDPTERKKLVEELFGIVSGRVKEFVFKHDSTRIIQCALKYANMAQRKAIARELQGTYRTLAESKYGKHLVAKLMVEGDKEVKDMIINEFCGHVRRLINHSEASWILDDIYRAAATKEQKAAMLREWYGPEFALFKSNDRAKATTPLSNVLAESPQKRKPIMDHLQNMINQLIQKKLTGFTMLHDAMLQYYINCKPGSEEATEFLEKLKGEGDEEDKDYDLLKNLAFTASGSRVVCLALANGNAKDRRHILKVYKDMIEMLEHDEHGHKVLLAACEVVDDTVTLTKTLFPKFIARGDVSEELLEIIGSLATSKGARIPLLCSLALENSGSTIPKWLLPPADVEILREVHELRKTTSKKDPSTRRKEIIRVLSPALLATVATQSVALASTTEGCQFATEVLLGAEGDKIAALDATANLAAGDISAEAHVAQDASACRMLKTLVQGGHFNTQTKEILQVQSPKDFCERLWPRMEQHLVQWATGPGVWVVIALMEQEWQGRSVMINLLRSNKPSLKKALKEAAAEKSTKGSNKAETDGSQTQNLKPVIGGVRLLLEKLD